ncbi:hypothetical protein GCM10009613_45340 [Pseudonocardia kongjuensis]|uniref:ANTAR domain-containing protein n=1 Tax=Pseudonocardia kongjuensis TaxID=102227 RepID=A0ABN1Y1S9_9PSEU
MRSGAEARALRAVHDGPLFHATRSPYLILDRELRVHAANPAYHAVTQREPGELDGRLLFDVLPDDPQRPGSDGVARLTASLLRVLRSGERDHMGLQRYDIPAPRAGSGHLRKLWVAVNSPVRDAADRTIGVLVHVEDVTELWARRRGGPLPEPGPADGPADGPAADPISATALAREVAAENRRLRHRFDRHVVIEQAKGVLMATRGCGPDEAFALLRELSQVTNNKLWQVARTVIDESIGSGAG